MNDTHTLLEISRKKNEDLHEQYRRLLNEHNVTRSQLRTAASIIADILEGMSFFEPTRIRANGFLRTYFDFDDLSPSSYQPEVA